MLSWGGRGGRRRSASFSALAWLPSPSSHLCPASIPDPPPLPPCREGGAGNVCSRETSMGGRTKWEQAHTTHSHSFSWAKPQRDIRCGPCPQRPQRPGGETGCEETAVIPDSRPRQAGPGLHCSRCTCSDWERTGKDQVPTEGVLKGERQKGAKGRAQGSGAQGGTPLCPGTRNSGNTCNRRWWEAEPRRVSGARADRENSTHRGPGRVSLGCWGSDGKGVQNRRSGKR